MTITSFLHTFGDPGTLEGAIFYAVLLLFAAWAVGEFICIAVDRSLKRAERKGVDSTSFRFLADLARVVVYICALLVYTHIIPALQSLSTAWIASLGVVSLIFGLAAQSTLSNIISGISLILYRPFQIGDRIQVAAPTGTEIGLVESIKLGNTSLRTTDGRRVVFSNTTIAGLTTINLSKNLPHMLYDIPVTISKDSDPAKARALLLEIAKEIPHIAKVYGAYVTTIGNAGTVLTLSSASVDPGDVALVRSTVLEKAREAFIKAGIELG
jgi:small-conductance mechanosensitive channel